VTSSSLAPTPSPTPSPTTTTLGALLATGYEPRSIKAELRANLTQRLRDGQPTLPGIVGFEETVGPDVERAPRPERAATLAQLNECLARAIALQLRHSTRP
jgi:magnesium chelatase subunit I